MRICINENSMNLRMCKNSLPSKLPHVGFFPDRNKLEPMTIKLFEGPNNPDPSFIKPED